MYTLVCTNRHHDTPCVYWFNSLKLARICARPDVDEINFIYEQGNSNPIETHSLIKGA